MRTGPGTCPAPGRIAIFLGEQAGQRIAEIDRREQHDHQRQQEVRHRKAEIAAELQAVVHEGVVAGGRDDADRDRDGVG